MLIPQKAIANFLTSHPLGTLGTLNKKGDLELMAVYLLVNPDLSCHIVTKANTRKCKNILSRPTGTILCYAEDELTSVELSGKLELVLDTIEIVKVLERFQGMAEKRRVGYWVPPIAQLKAGSYAIITLTPAKVLYRRYADVKRGGKKMTEVVLRKKNKQLERLKGNE